MGKMKGLTVCRSWRNPSNNFGSLWQSLLKSGKISLILSGFLLLSPLIPGFAQSAVAQNAVQNTIQSMAQNAAPLQRFWYPLDRGRSLFYSGNLGEALLSFEDARRIRREEYTRMEGEFIEELSLPEARLIGDSLAGLEVYIADQRRSKAAAVLTELYFRKPREVYNNSVRALLAELHRQKEYPEAEYWIGEVYRREGEYDLAMEQYRRAFSHREQLDSPAFELQIRYRMAEVLRLNLLRNGEPDYGALTDEEVGALSALEEALLGIVLSDSLWNQNSGAFTRSALSRTLENDGIDRFLTLYRYRNTAVEPAHRLLGDYYYRIGDYDKAAEHLLFAFLIQNTVLIEEILRDNYDFKFNGLSDLAAQTRRQPYLLAYMEESDYFRTIYYLGLAMGQSGRPRAHAAFRSFLVEGSDFPPFAAEWTH
jgi:tetratricopeptide (TPR) repeat protein